jgi:hypothetical protein
MPLHIHVQRVERNNKIIEELEREVVRFLEELDARLAKLQRLSAAQMSAGDGEEPQPAKRRPSVVAPEKRIVQRIALACKDPLFQRFVAGDKQEHITEDSAAEYVRQYCGVASRSEIIEGSEAARRAHTLLEEFAAWRDHPEVTA